MVIILIKKILEKEFLNFGFIIDNRNCIGCHACTVACKAEHDVPIGVNRTWVKYVEKGQFPDTRRVFSVMRCNHCEYAPCVEICPTQALFTRPDGIVDFNNQRCIGCKSCTQACPYDAIYIDPESLTAAKCNYCAHRIDVGLEPACVNVCPTNAIVSGDLDQKNTNISNLVSRQQVTARKPEKGTRPKLFYIEGDDVSLKPLETENSLESLWGSQSLGVGHHSGKEYQNTINIDSNKKKSPKKKDLTKKENVRNQFFPFKKGLSGGKTEARKVYDSPSKGILWGWEVAGYIITKALSAGILGLPILLSQLELVKVSNETLWVTSLISIFFLAATGILLILDLDQPKRFLYVILRPHWKSWLVKGGYTITIYGGLITLFGIANFFGYGELSKWLMWPILAFSVMLAIYTAFLFAQAKGRDFWQSPILILHMLLHAVVGGCAFLLIACFFWESINPMTNYLQKILTGTLVVQLFSIIAEITIPHPTEDSHRTVQLIVKGVFKSQFWGGVIIFGTILPLLMLVLSFSPLILALAGLLVLFGLWYSVRIWVIAPQLIPLS